MVSEAIPDDCHLPVQAISAQGPKPTDEPTLAAQLAAIPALSRLSPHEIRELEKMQLETSANNASVKAIAARKKVAARKTHRRLHIMGGKLRGMCRRMAVLWSGQARRICCNWLDLLRCLLLVLGVANR